LEILGLNILNVVSQIATSLTRDARKRLPSHDAISGLLNRARGSAGMWLILFSLVAIQASAATFFVRPGGSGNGSTWASAWGDLNTISWSSLSPGSVVCIAGGSYSGDIITAKSGTAGSPITLKRATASDATCGSSTSGWSAGFDAQVVMTGTINLYNDYNVIDGVVPNGISIVMQNPSGNDYKGIGAGAPTTGVTLAHIEVAGPCPNNTPCFQNGDHRSINLNHWNGASYDLQTNLTIQYSNLHGACNLLWSAHSSNLVIEHTRFADNYNTDPASAHCHANVFIHQDAANFVFRYNEVTQWDVEGILACPSHACSSNGAIYGNIWHDPSGDNARVLEAQYGPTGPFVLYNNTFVRIGNLCTTTGANGGSYVSGTMGRNNIFWGGPKANCELPDEDYDVSTQPLAEAHGQGGVINLFLNLLAKDFHLALHTAPGLTLPAPYNIDYDGNPRGTGGIWDRGAYQLGSVGGGSTSSSPPAPPTNLTVSVR
jgi:hypothetical protein